MCPTKIIAKVLSNRMKNVLSFVIDEAQSGFVLGCVIMDNEIIAFEAFHNLRIANRLMDHSMAIKLDMNKAYDRVK